MKNQEEAIFGDERLEDDRPYNPYPIEKCFECGEDIYEGDEIYVDTPMGEVLCNEQCVKQYLGVEENVIPEGVISECHCCHSYLNSKEESIRTIDGLLFCDLNCALEWHEIRLKKVFEGTYK